MLALNQYLAQLGGTQILLSVRQQWLVEAVGCTVEMESYTRLPKWTWKKPLLLLPPKVNY